MVRPIKNSLNDKELRAKIKAGEKQINVGGVAGLMLRVKDATAYSGLWLLVSQGKMRFKKSLGTYPKPVTLAAAREAALALLAEVKRTGISPVEKERREREERAAAEAEARRRETVPTVDELFTQWQSEAARRPKYDTRRSQTDATIYRTHIAPIIGKKIISAVTVDDLFAVCFEAAKPDKLRKADEGRSAEGGFLSGTYQGKIREILSALQYCAAANGQIKANLCLSAEYRTRLQGLTKPPRDAHNGALRPCEVPAFIRALCEYIATKDAGLRSSVAARMLLFAVLTSSRKKNGILAKHGQIADGVWTIPAHEMKVPENGAHVVYLPPEVQALVAASPRLEGVDYIFPSARSSKGHYTDGVFAPVMRDLNAARVGREGKRWIDETQTRDLGREIAATPHGIARASFKTWFYEGGMRDCAGGQPSPMAVELALHHVKETGDGLGGAYFRGDLLEERRRLSAAWARFCLSETPPELWAKVVRKPWEGAEAPKAVGGGCPSPAQAANESADDEDARLFGMYGKSR